MPYVTVWVDDNDCTCDGDCESTQIKVEAIKTALAAIQDGRISDATDILGEACDDQDFANHKKREQELAMLLATWRKLPAPRDDFLTFAHGKRKASLT